MTLTRRGLIVMPNDEKASRCNAVARRGGGNEILILGKISLFVEMAGTLAQCLGIGAEGLFGQRSSPPAESWILRRCIRATSDM